MLVQLSLFRKNVDTEQLHVDFVAHLSGQTPQEGAGLGLRRVSHRTVHGFLSLYVRSGGRHLAVRDDDLVRFWRMWMLPNKISSGEKPLTLGKSEGNYQDCEVRAGETESVAVNSWNKFLARTSAQIFSFRYTDS